MNIKGKAINLEELSGVLDLMLNNKADKEILRSLFIWGMPGIGKTEFIKAYCIKKDLEYAYCAPAQFEEMGDFHGLPYVDGEKMLYKKPSWVPDNTKKQGVLLLDDFNRADIRIIKGLMQLIQYREISSWSIPKDWIIVCTGNPENELFSTTSFDSAIMSRFMHVTLNWNHKIWAKWALEKGINPNFINFVLNHPETLENGEITSPRTITTFFSMIEGLKPIKEHLNIIEILGLGLLDSETVASFIYFINNISQRIVEPKVLLNIYDENLINDYVDELLTSDEGVRLDLINTFFERLVIYLEETPNRVFKSENLASFISHKIIPNDFRTRMYLELNKYENPTIKKALKNKIVTNAISKAN